MRALSSAQQSIVDETSSDILENDEVGRDRYQIVNSYLPVNGDYQIAKRKCSFYRYKTIRFFFIVLSSPDIGCRW